jgi:hypothetical protein
VLPHKCIPSLEEREVVDTTVGILDELARLDGTWVAGKQSQNEEGL